MNLIVVDHHFPMKTYENYIFHWAKLLIRQSLCLLAYTCLNLPWFLLVKPHDVPIPVGNPQDPQGQMGPTGAVLHMAGIRRS